MDWASSPVAGFSRLVAFLALLLLSGPSLGHPPTARPPGDQPRVRELPFARSLQDPCAAGAGRRANRTQAQRRSYSLAFYGYMADYGTLYRQDAQRVLNESTIEDCGVLNLPILPSTPSLQELQEMDAESALKQVHSSLLLHTAYAYFVQHEYTTSSVTCSEADANRERNLAHEAIILARKQKHMACMTQMTLEGLGITPNNISELLDERFLNLGVCSRRALRDCQVVLSIIHLLDMIANYTKSKLEELQASN